MKNRFSCKSIFVVIFVLTALQGCGVKGKLVLPEQQNEQNKAAEADTETTENTEQ